MDINDAMAAAYENDAFTLQRMINNGLAPDSIHPLAGHTLLQAACEADAVEAIKCLVENGCDVNMKFTKISRVDGHKICENGTAIMFAQSVNAAKILLSAGAKLDVVAANGESVIDWAKSWQNPELLSFYERH